MKLTVIATAIAFGVGSFGSWYLTNKYVSSKYEAIILKANMDATATLARMIERKNEAESRLNGIRNDVDQEYRQTIENKDRTIARLRSDNVRLRDPGYQSNRNACPGDSRDSGSNAETIAAEGALSEQATGFLFEFASSADDTLEQLRACREWNEQIKQTLDNWNKARK